MNRNKVKKPKRLTKQQAKTIELVRADPLASNYEIGKELKVLRVAENSQSIYSNLRKSEYINGEITRIRDHHIERMSREAMPAAIDVHIERLKSKPSKELWCPTKEKPVSIGNDCKICDRLSVCVEHFKHKEMARHHNEGKREWVKMAEAVEFKIDDSKRPSVPQIVNYTEIQAIIHQTIMRDDVVQTEPDKG